MDLVSVIIPTYKRSDSLCRCIDSVLNQTYPNIEIIVVDDNGEGTDYQKETEKNIKKYIDSGKILYLKHNVNKNGSAARNTGFRASSGEFVNFLDDDDYLEAEKIERQVELLKAISSDYGAVYCKSKFQCITKFLKKNKVWYSNYTGKGNIVRDYLLGIAEFNTSTLLFRRSVIKALQGFDETYIRHQDYELMVRFFRKYMVDCVPGKYLMVYDLSIDRGNVPSLVRFRDVRIKFLTQFKNDLQKWGFYQELAHKWWLQNLQLAIETRKYCMIPEFYKLTIKYGRISIKEWVAIIKPFFQSLLCF